MASGFLFLFIGVGFFFGGADLTIGSASSMGEGYFPRLLSVTLISIGVLSLCRAAYGRYCK